jgi:N-methylhydantoinase A
LQVPVTLAQLEAGDREIIRVAFDALYQHRYSHHSPDEPVEMVNIRLAVVGERPRLRFPSVASDAKARPARRRKVFLSGAREPAECPVYDRPALGSGATINGPAIIQEHGTATMLFEGDICRVVESGEMVIEVGGVK